MKKWWAMLIILVFLTMGCTGIRTGDKNETNVVNVITTLDSEGDEVAVMVLAANGTTWVEVEKASPELLATRNVETVNGKYTYLPGG